MDSSSNPTAVSATTTSDYYDAFLNYRGRDVKKTLATSLHQRLTDCGLRVFLDKEELQEGDNIPSLLKAAIRSAAVHIAIFSTNYAESTWCLNELLLMFESGKPILPIFFGVKPSELRHALGDTGRHLDLLEKKKAIKSESRLQNRRYDPKTVKEWREALRKASYIMGFEVEAEACNRYDMQLLDKIVKRVLEKLPKTLLDVSKYPTGLNDKIEDFESVSKYPTGLDDKIEDFERTVLMPPQSGNTRVVGIAGLGGVGKTTLAKEFFNRESSKYDRSCFLPDVREKAASRSLNSLQSILLEHLTGSKVQINSIHEGRGELTKRLSSSRPRALVILDDVDHIDQLDALLFPLNEARLLGCLILVTSRNKDVLTSFGIVATSIYKLEGLHLHHSRELFCSHAFNQPYPVEGFEELVGSFLDACHGLPLFLRVIGVLLRGNKDLNHWNAQLQKISKMLPDEIQAKLRISYDSLDVEEKHIFLDIACIFIGEDRDTAIRMWDESGWQGWLGLWKLENRCLVEVDSKNCIRMPDHLRDLGRYLAEKEPPGPELRLWCPTDNFLQKFSDQSPVRAIGLVHGNGCTQQYFENLASSCNLSRLKLLRIQGDCVERVFSAGNFPELIYLRWENFPRVAIPSCIRIKNLRALYIDGRYMETLWQHEYEAPLQLRELYINARLLEVPEFICKMKHLEKFVLHFSALKTLPYEFGYTRSLKHVDLKGCKYLTRLPDSVGHLMSLQSLDLTDCSSLQALPDSVGHLMSLQSLDLTDCSSLQALPDSVGQLMSLQSLDLTDCSSLQALPDSVGHLMRLQSLNLSRCSKLQALPDSVGSLTSLQSLELSGCSTLQVLPDSVECLTSLQSLDLSGCSTLQALSFSLGGLTSLQGLSLDLSRCSKLQALPDSVGSLTSLQSLELRGCSTLQVLPDSVGCLTSLQSLDLSRCSTLQALPDSVGRLASLQSLDLSGCSTLQALPDSVAGLASLQILDLSGCSTLQALPDSVAGLASLQSLDLSGCSILQALPESVAGLIALQHFELSGCSNLKMLPDSFGGLTNLRHVNLSRCSNLERLPDSFGGLTNLHHVNLSECSSLHKFPNSLKNLKNLRYINLSEYSNLVMLPYSFGNLRNLQHINLSGCSNLQMLPNSLENMQNLKHIDLSRCSKLQMLPNFFGNLSNLQHIDLSWCSNLKMLPNTFGNLTRLQHVDLSGCSSLPILPKFFGNLIQLKHLCLSKCYDLTISSETLGKIRTLEWLEISGCYRIEVLPPQVAHQRFLREMYLFCPFLKELPSDMEELCNLKTLHLASSCLDLLEIETLVSLEDLRTRECVKLKRIQGLSQLTKLLILDVAKCSELEQLEGVESLRSLVELDASECPNLQWSTGVMKQLREQLKESLITH